MGSAGTLRTQRRGKGSPRWKFPSHRASIKISLPKQEGEGVVLDIIYHYSHTAPIAKVKLNNEIFYIPAPLGIGVGDIIRVGKVENPREGDILQLKDIPEGSKIYNIELTPGDGGKLVRSAGSYAILLAKEDKYAIVKLPSKKIKKININSRAILGVIAGGNRKDKPLIKAGKAYWYKRWKKHKNWPHSAAMAMVARDHPFGGGKRRAHYPKTTARRLPRGKRVGSIAARRTGRRKK